MIDRSRALLPIALASAVLAAGCGGEEEPASEPASLTKEEYLVEADATCARVNQDLQAIQDFQQDGPPIIEQGLGELENIPAPEGDEEQLASIYEEGQSALDELQGPSPPRGDPFKEFTKLASDYGFEKGCTANQG